MIVCEFDPNNGFKVVISGIKINCYFQIYFFFYCNSMMDFLCFTKLHIGEVGASVCSVEKYTGQISSTKTEFCILLQFKRCNDMIRL